MPRTRLSAATESVPLRALPAAALRQVLREGYGLADLRADLLAGLVVGVVAIPLSMALAIASGVAPQHGLYTAIVAGVAVALLGGSRVQVTGPTAAFVVVLAGVSERFGLGGLLVATTMAGALLLALGLVRLGSLIQFVPYPVTMGFTAGIAVVIATLQLRDFAGLQIPQMPPHWVERVVALATALPSARWPELATGVFTLAVLLAWPRVSRALPAPLVALGLATAGTALLAQLFPGFGVDTVGSRFEFAAGGPPLFVLPWSLPGSDGRPLALTFDLVRALAPSAFAIAMLGAIESLLCAVVADGMTGTKHDPDSELLALGVGNLLVPFFGGFAATGAIARTATNVRSGARSPMASVFHSGSVLAALLAVAPLLALLPMASLAALLLVVAWNMSEAKHFANMVRIAPRSDVFVLLTCFGLTILFDMVLAVTAGVLLAALLFMRRMAELSSVTLVGKGHAALVPPLPPGVILYDVAGPLFFGAAQKAMGTIESVGGGVRTVVLDLRDVPAMDATGLVNLDSAVRGLVRRGIQVILGGVQPQPLRVLERAGWTSEEGRLVVCEHFEDAVALARLLVPPSTPPLPA